MTEPDRLAAEWFDLHPYKNGVLTRQALICGSILARAVREQEQELAHVTSERDSYAIARDTNVRYLREAQAEIERLRAAVKGGPCETCRHQNLWSCGLTVKEGFLFTSCHDLGGGCWAWEPKT